MVADRLRDLLAVFDDGQLRGVLEERLARSTRRALALPPRFVLLPATGVPLALPATTASACRLVSLRNMAGACAASCRPVALRVLAGIPTAATASATG